MKSRVAVVPIVLAALINLWAYPDEMPKVKNASEAMNVSLLYLREHNSQNAPGTSIKWHEKTIYSEGPGDLVTTSKQFTSDDWIVEISQNLAPLRNVVYQVAIFSPVIGWYWKGSINAEGIVREESAFKQLSDDKKREMTEGFLKKSRTPAPVGGYGH
jgi:hypothetical protein